MSKFLRNPFSFLTAGSQKEELMAEYVIREHHRGRSLTEILDDAHIRTTARPQQIHRLLDRPEVVHALGEDVVAAHRSDAPSRRLDSRASSTTRAAAARSHAAIPFDLKTTMSSGEARPCSSPATTSWSSCTSSQSSTPDATGSIRSPDSSRACSRESQHTNAARSSTTLSSSRRAGSFAPTAQTSAPGWSHSPRSTGSRERRDRDDDVLLGGLAVRLGRLAAVRLAERGEPRGVAAVDDGRARAPGSAARMHATCDSACQPQPITPRLAASGLREVPRRDRGRRAGAELPEPVGLDHGLEPPVEREEHDDERDRPGRRPGVRLEPGVPELAVDAGHHRVLPVGERQPLARPVVDRAAREPAERLLDGRRPRPPGEQRVDVGLGQVERHRGYGSDAAPGPLGHDAADEEDRGARARTTR